MVRMGIIKECGVSQQFQRGAYIQVQRFRCGKKGFGLKVMENVCKDSFIIEYVGEVCALAFLPSSTVLVLIVLAQRVVWWLRNGLK
jgi:hypothetical protein